LEQRDWSEYFRTEFAKEKSARKAEYDRDLSEAIRRFRRAVYDVHHLGEPLEEEKDDELAVVSSGDDFKEQNCPVTLQPITADSLPLMNHACHHIYSTAGIEYHIANKTKSIAPSKRDTAPVRCPVAGCKQTLTRARLEPAVAFLHRLKAAIDKQKRKPATATTAGAGAGSGSGNSRATTATGNKATTRDDRKSMTTDLTQSSTTAAGAASGTGAGAGTGGADDLEDISQTQPAKKRRAGAGVAVKQEKSASSAGMEDDPVSSA
jgi:hypothetical protein